MLVFVAVVGLVSVSLFEALFLKTSLRARRAVSIRAGRPRSAPASENLRERLYAHALLASSDYRTNALPRADAADWSVLDREALERSGTAGDVLVEFSPKHAALSFTSAESIGKNRFLWSLLYDLRLDGKELVVEPRVYVGGIAFWLVIGAAVLAISSVPVFGVMTIVWAIVRAIMTAHVVSSRGAAFAERAIRLVEEAAARTPRLRVDAPAGDAAIAAAEPAEEPAEEEPAETEPPAKRTFRRG